MTWTFTPPSKGFFKANEKAQVVRLQARLVPSASEHGIVGAGEAGAGTFVDRLLAMPHETYYEIAAWRDLYRDGLAALDKAAQKRYGHGICELSDWDCDDLLSSLEAGTLDEMPAEIDQPRFFRTLWRHALQGCFCDPRWGGNRDKIMWRAYGYLEDVGERGGRVE